MSGERLQDDWSSSKILTFLYILPLHDGHARYSIFLSYVDCSVGRVSDTSFITIQRRDFYFLTFIYVTN